MPALSENIRVQQFDTSPAPSFFSAERLAYLGENRDFYRMFLDTTRKFTSDPKFQEMVKRSRENPERYPWGFMQACGDMGLLGTTIPETYQGSDLPMLIQVDMLKKLAKGDAGFALNALVQNTLSALPIIIGGSEEQQKRFLPGLASGELIGCFALTEAKTGGSDATHLQTRAKETADGWEIHGEKTYITSANALKEKPGVMILAARTGTEQGQEGKHGISAFVVEIGPETEGITITTMPKTMQPGSQFCSISFNGFKIPKSALLGELNQGWELVINPTLERSRDWIAAQAVGVAQHAYEIIYEHAINTTVKRSSRDGELSIADLNVELFNYMARQIEISEFLTLDAAIRFDNHDPNFAFSASLAKFIAASTAKFVTDHAYRLNGGDSARLDSEIGRLLLDAKIIETYEGSAEVQLEIIDKYLDKIGLDRSVLTGITTMGDLALTEKSKLANLSSLEQVVELINRLNVMLDNLSRSSN